MWPRHWLFEIRSDVSLQLTNNLGVHVFNTDFSSNKTKQEWLKHLPHKRHHHGYRSLKTNKQKNHPCLHIKWIVRSKSHQTILCQLHKAWQMSLLCQLGTWWGWPELVLFSKLKSHLLENVTRILEREKWAHTYNNMEYSEFTTKFNLNYGSNWNSFMNRMVKLSLVCNVTCKNYAKLEQAQLRKHSLSALFSERRICTTWLHDFDQYVAK